MSGYSCSDCKEGELLVRAREIELEDGEIASVLDSGVIIATKIACSNEGCSSHAEAGTEEEEEEAETVEPGACGKKGCKKTVPHRHNKRRAEA